jgi:hypothetical protein
MSTTLGTATAAESCEVVDRDARFAAQVLADLSDPDRGVLPAGPRDGRGPSVATYASAGFERLPDVTDVRRPG